jgi:hypothetical protein
MSKQDAEKPPDGDDPAASAKEPPRDGASAIRERIGRELRAMFEEVVAQPVPEKLRKLLEELARKQSNS